MDRYARQQVQRNIERAGTHVADALAVARATLTLDDVPVLRMLTQAQHTCDDATQLLDEFPDELACTTCGAPVTAQDAPATDGFDQCPDCGALHRVPTPTPPTPGAVEDDVRF